VIEYCRRTEPNDARQCRLTFFGERLLLRSSTGRNGSNCDVDVRVRPILLKNSVNCQFASMS
jgi:hypothetical protein